MEGGSGAKRVMSTALGMTETREGGRHARITVFALLVLDTQTTWDGGGESAALMVMTLAMTRWRW